jgi:Peptidase family M48
MTSKPDLALSRVDPNQLPSGTVVYFIVIILTSVMVAFWLGEFLPGLDYFTTPFGAQFQPGIFSLAHGFYGVGTVLIVSAALFTHHFYRQRKAFGPYNVVDREGQASSTVASLSQKMGVAIPALLSDRDITNADAISFGVLKGRTILLGKRLLLMADKRLPAFDARIAHELGHFKNGDIKYAVMSRALLEANIFLMLLVLVWLCFLQARVVLMQYYLFNSPVTGLPGATPYLFFKLHGLHWAGFWLSRSLGTLVITIPVFVFWGVPVGNQTRTYR